MSKRRCFFAMGWEGSGTNLLAEALVSAGCHYEGWHAGYNDDYKFDEMPDLLVFRRSLPHAHRWPDLQHLRNQMENAGYSVQPLFTVRDWNSTICSVIRRGYQGSREDCEGNMRYALGHVYEGFGDELIVVSYEAFCQSPAFRKWLFCDRLGLKEPTIKIRPSENEKYYD